MMRKIWVIGLLLWGVALFWFLAACRQKPTVEPGFIRYEIDRTPYRIVNRSPYTIELLRYPMSYQLYEAGWSPLRPLTSICADIPDYGDEGVIPSGTEWSAWWEGGTSPCPDPEEACGYFAAWRYRVPSQPGRTFVVYSNEGRGADPARAKVAQLSISLSPNNEPFHFTVHSDLDEPMWLCWGWRSNTACTWESYSRLERETGYGTWEILSHTLDLCESGVTYGLEVPPGQSVIVDGTRAYSDYTQLPPGVYRWVIVLRHRTTLERLIFSPQFEWGNVSTPGD